MNEHDIFRTLSTRRGIGTGALALTLGFAVVACDDGEGMGGIDMGDTDDGDGDVGDGDGDGDIGDGNGDGDGDAGDGDGDVDDTTPPTIVSISPEDGEAGVVVDESIVIEFSEPMDKGATQAAYQSLDIPAGAVTFSWNTAGDVLTITPNELLEWSFVDSPADPALEYAWSINTAATDKAGNELGLGIDATFTTMRGQMVIVPPNDALTGAVRTGDEYIFSLESWGSLYIGDSGTPNSDTTSHNQQYRAMFSFDFSALPEQTVGIGAATLYVTQTPLNDDPYSVLGDLYIDDVEYDTLDLDAVMAPAVADMGILSAGLSPATIERDVVDQVAADFQTDGLEGDTQFRAYFEIASLEDGKPQNLQVKPDDISLWVVAAYP